jgi:hypothetical protein
LVSPHPRIRKPATVIEMMTRNQFALYVSIDMVLAVIERALEVAAGADADSVYELLRDTRTRLLALEPRARKST